MPKTTITLSELRKQLKQVGAKVKTQTLSFGVSATVYNSEGKQLPSMFMGEDHLNQWKPVLEIIKDIVVVNDYSDKISGPWN